jgi:hypothetical protein
MIVVKERVVRVREQHFFTIDSFFVLFSGEILNNLR